MFPAHEGLDSHDRPGGEDDLGLEEEDELAVLDRVPEVRLEGEPLADRLVEGGRAELKVVPAAVFGAIQSNVRVPEERVSVGAVLGEEADPDARRHRNVMRVGDERGRDRFEDLAGERRDMLLFEVHDEEHELVAPDARDGIACSHAPAQPRRDLPQDLIADPVSHRVVHELESVEVEEEQGESRAGTLGLCESKHHVVLEELAVRKAGQRVVVREVLDLFLGALAVRDVDAGPLDDERAPVLLNDRAALERPEERPVAAPAAGLFVYEAALLEEPLDPGRAVGLRRVKLLRGCAERVLARSEAVHARERFVALEDLALERRPEEAGRIALIDTAVSRFGAPKGLFGPRACRRVAEAPDAPDRLPVEALRDRVAFEDPAVPEAECVETLVLGAAVELLDPADEPLRVHELAENVLEKALVVSRLEKLRGDPPQLLEAPVVRHDASLEIDGENSVGRRLESGFEEGERAADRGLRVLARESGRDVLRDLRQEARLALAEADGTAVALDDEGPEDTNAGLQRHADPVERGGADRLDLSPAYETLEELR